MPPGPPCLSALESPFLMAPGQAWLSFQGLLSEPFWTFLTTALVSRADPMCRPLSLVLYTHGLTYFSQICEVGTYYSHFADDTEGLRDSKPPAQGHPVYMWQDKDFIPACLLQSPHAPMGPPFPKSQLPC